MCTMNFTVHCLKKKKNRSFKVLHCQRMPLLQFNGHSPYSYISKVAFYV